MLLRSYRKHVTSILKVSLNDWHGIVCCLVYRSRHHIYVAEEAWPAALGPRADESVVGIVRTSSKRPVPRQYATWVCGEGISALRSSPRPVVDDVAILPLLQLSWYGGVLYPYY